jgi:hypothetical protein
LQTVMLSQESKVGRRFSCLGRQDQAPLVLGQRFPLVREELPQAIDRMAHDPPEHVVEVLPGVDSTVLAGSDEAHEQRCRPTAPFASHEEPVLPTQGDRAHGVFRQVVVRPEPPVFQVAAQGLSLIQGVIDRLPKRFRRGRLRSERFKLLEDSRKERCGMLLPEEAPFLGFHVGAGGLHLVVEPGDAGQDVRRLFRTGCCRFVELPPGMSPAAHLEDVLLFEELIVTAVGVGMDIPLIILEKFKRPLLAAIDGEVIDRKRRAGPSPHTNPHPGPLELPVPLDLQGNGRVVGERDTPFQDGQSEDLLQNLDALIDLHQPTALGRPRDRHPLPIEDVVLAVEGEVIDELADDQMGDQSHIGFALGDRMIGHRRGDHAAERIGAFGQGVLGPLVDVDDELARPVFKLFRDLDGDHLQGFARFGADLLLLGDVQQDFHPFEVFGNGNATMMLGSLPWLDGFRLNRDIGCQRHLWSVLFQRLQDDGIEHHLVGVELLGLTTIETPEHLLHLVLKGGQLPLGGFELSGEFSDLGILLRGDFEDQKILLRDELVGLREGQYHETRSSALS